MNSPNISNTPTKPRENRGRALLLEHLPDIKFRQSIQGVLFIVFSNGEAFFYPLNDQSKGNHPGTSNPARLLTLEPSERTKKITQGKQPMPSPTPSTPSNSSTGSSTASKSGSSEVISDVNRYFVYDTLVPFKDDMFRVFTFCFEDQSSPPSFNEDGPPNLESTGPIQSLLPRKISLSPNKRLLLILGAIYRGQSCLLVYQILEEGTGTDFFKLIFFDFSFAFVDVCFSSDSKGLLAIPTKFPSYVFMLSLPLPSSQSQTSNPTNPATKTTSKKSFSFNPPNSQIDSSLKMRTVNFEARRAGPLTIIGPGKGLLGQPLKMSHIASNSCQIINNPEIDYYHFVTWNDEPLGEYCLWRLCKDGNFESSPRCAVAKYDKSILEKSDTQKNFIIEIQFSSREGKLMLVIKKENYPKKSENGIGLQTVKLEPSPDSLDNRNWYQVVDCSEPIFCIKWTNTLLLGTVQAAAILIKGKGLFELVDSCYASEFQAFYDTFKEEAHNFVQVGRYHRFWVGSNGALHVMVVTPQLPSNHPEWCELFKQPQNSQVLINMRILGRRIGYAISDISKEGPTTASRKPQKKPIENGTAKLQTGGLHRYCGFHLYRCWMCKRPLLKPLACSRCLSVVYCSKVCQQNDWATHRAVCQQKT